MTARAVVLGFWLAMVSTALAHIVEPRDAPDLRWQWASEPASTILLVVTALIWGRGIIRLRRASPHSVKARDMFCFAAGWFTLVIALVSPLHPLGALLFSAHMTQHELLMLVAAPLIVLGRPVVAFLWALPKPSAIRLNKAAQTGPWQHSWTL